jgi:LmbE family N-acetylglucosaminyl deacetylase
VLVVIAHPDDESFGLGSVLSALIRRGVRGSVLCFTQGESSTLGADLPELTMLRRKEMNAAADTLGIDDITLLTYPDGRLDETTMEELVGHILKAAWGIDAFLVFDEGGVTGHPDHCRATDVALAAAEVLDLPVLAWAIPAPLAQQLNTEFGTSFVGREENQLDLVIEVDRARQLEAIACHRSQSAENPVLWRRLSLMGDNEWLRWLRLPLSRGGGYTSSQPPG